MTCTLVAGSHAIGNRTETGIKMKKSTQHTGNQGKNTEAAAGVQTPASPAERHGRFSPRGMLDGLSFRCFLPSMIRREK